MAIDRQFNEVIFICDTCEDTFDSGEEDFDTAKDDMKKAGWKITKEGDEWKHYCRGCRGDGGFQDETGVTRRVGYWMDDD